jgi:hypothetical protein
MPHSQVVAFGASQQLRTHLKPGGQSPFVLHGSAALHARGATQKQHDEPIVRKQKQLAVELQLGRPLQIAHGVLVWPLANRVPQMLRLFAADAVADQTSGVPSATAPTPPYFSTCRRVNRVSVAMRLLPVAGCTVERTAARPAAPSPLRLKVAPRYG